MYHVCTRIVYMYIVTCHDIRSYSICERDERDERDIVLHSFFFQLFSFTIQIIRKSRDQLPAFCDLYCTFFLLSIGLLKVNNKHHMIIGLRVD